MHEKGVKPLGLIFRKTMIARDERRFPQDGFQHRGCSRALFASGLIFFLAADSS
jgi:hypothetical protein